MKRILVIGRGHLGTYLKDLWGLPDDLWFTANMSELTVQHLEAIRPDAVVNAAGSTNLEWCEAHPRECFRNNVEEPLAVYRLVRLANRNVPYIHLSSGCVWDGPYKSSPPFAQYSGFESNDRPTPQCFYAWTKAAFDALLLKEASTPVCILRPRQVFSPSNRGRNTLLKLIQYGGLIDTPNTMTSAETIAKTIQVLTDDTAKAIWAWHRIVLVYDLGSTTPFEVGCRLAKAGMRQPPVRIEKADLDKTLKPKRVDVVMKDQMFENYIRPPMLSDQLDRAITLMKAGQMK